MGISIYVSELLEILSQEGKAVPVVVGGSVITPKDREALLQIGVAAAFGPGAKDADIVNRIRHLAKMGK